MDFHEAAQFPLLKGKDFEEFKRDIALHGLQEPIVLLEGKILDGRNRYRAILEIDDEAIQPEFTEYAGKQSPEDYVRSKNIYRRHLTASQRSMNAARARPAFEEEAKGRRTGRPKKSASKDADLSPRKAGDRGRASTAAGKAAKVSSASVDRARHVLDCGVKQLADLVDQGEVSVGAASVVSSLPKPQLHKLCQEGPKAVRHKAIQMRRSAKTKPKSKDSRDALTVADTILVDLEKLIGYVKACEGGGPSIRESVIANLRLAKKYVSASRKLFL